MKIAWVTNAIIGDLATKKGLRATSGQWLNAELAAEKERGENQLLICTSGETAETLETNAIKYIVLPHGNVSQYAITEEHIRDWERIFAEEKPDVILVWGTEYDIGKCALMANNKKISSLIYIQGVMCSIAENYRGGLSDAEINSFTTVLEKIRKTSVFDIEKRQREKAAAEKEAIFLADGVIVENDWAAEQYKSLSKDILVFRNRLPIKKEFATYTWQADTCRRHAIVTTAAMYPLKGLHKLLEAIKLLKEKYPDIRLYVPGPNGVILHNLRAKLLQGGYCKWLNRYIKKNNLLENIVFTGPLSTEQYAEEMRSAEVFVTASAIENHCSALREAMSVGVPCVSSRVGGIPEFAVNGENCTLYDFSDASALATAIEGLFEDAERKERYSKAAKETIQRMYTVEKLMSLSDIYEAVFKS